VRLSEWRKIAFAPGPAKFMSNPHPAPAPEAADGAVGLPPRLRPRLHAGAELTLELLRIYSAALSLDIESIWILLCVTQQSMGSFVLDPDRAKVWNGAEVVSDAVRSPLSRRAVAERTGLPRETVRRKMAAMADQGLLMVDDYGGVRVQSSGWSVGALEDIAARIEAAVEQHQDRLGVAAGKVQ